MLNHLDSEMPNNSSNKIKTWLDMLRNYVATKSIDNTSGKFSCVHSLFNVVPLTHQVEQKSRVTLFVF